MLFLIITVCDNLFQISDLIYIYIYICSEECLIDNDPLKYFYVAQGMITIDNVDDAEEMRLTDEAFDILGFTQVYIDKKILLY